VTNIQEHFTSYCQSIRHSSLPGIDEYSRVCRTADTGSALTTYDFLRELYLRLIDWANEGQEEQYWPAVEQHQRTLLELHRAVASQHLPSGVNPANYLQPSPVLDVIQGQGWRWFRYTDGLLLFPITIKDKKLSLWLIPTYRMQHVSPVLDEIDEGIDGEPVTVDAEEMDLLTGLGRHHMAQDYLLSKVGRLATEKILQRGEPGNILFFKTPIENVNTPGHVADWALPLR